METVTGFVERIRYRNEENGYTVLSVSDTENGEEVTLVGSLLAVFEGDLIAAEGHMTEHPVYGPQLNVERFEVRTPENAQTMERYLASGAIKGVRAALASRIVKKFKEDTFRVIDEEPQRLAEVKGISTKLAGQIAAQMQEKIQMRRGLMFLQGYGISMNLAMKIYQKYGEGLYAVLRENPYRLAEDIRGIGFKVADEIAKRGGLATDSEERVRAGLLYVLAAAGSDGHTCLPKPVFCAKAAALLQVDEGLIEKQFMDLQIAKKIVVKCPKRPDGRRILSQGGEGEPALPDMEQAMIYLASHFYMELNAAKMLHDLNVQAHEDETEIRGKLKKILAPGDAQPDERQIQAVIEAVNSGVLVLTGGPGTGKTTTINMIIRYFELEGLEIMLAAPTGRAAKRMGETTGYEAKTIHRLLELSSPLNEDAAGERDTGKDGLLHFERNEDNPLEADVVIIDEMSMVDIYLFHSLLRALSVGTRLILVGDVDQLPSVGPGNILRDLIDSGCFRVVKLTRIFRQAAKSDIVVNAHRINEGEPVDLGKKSRDFLFIRAQDPNAAIVTATALIKNKLPGYVKAQQSEIQVITPMKKGVLGAQRLNQVLQQALNPPGKDKREKESAGGVYREGDKVMQIRNNYQLEWETRNKAGMVTEHGTGVFNGDVGIIREINDFAEMITVEFEEGRFAGYSYKQLDEIDLAYAITVHKSQGSEYPAVIIPMYAGPKMLMTRNLLYTAITRARLCVCLVGSPQAFVSMASNTQEQERYSGFKERIREAYFPEG